MSEPLRIPEGPRFRPAWERAEAAARARIEDAVKRGVALGDPHEAALAVGLATERRRSVTMGLVIGIFLGAILLAQGAAGKNMIVAVAGLIVSSVAAYAFKRRGALLKAELRNRDVVIAEMRRTAPPPPGGTPAPPWETGDPPPLSRG